jgi:hypothetical protein
MEIKVISHEISGPRIQFARAVLTVKLLVVLLAVGVLHCHSLTDATSTTYFDLL